MPKEKLLGKNPDELKAAALAAGLPAFAGKQLAQWLYVRRVRSFDEMTNISKAGRAKLAELYELGVSAPLGSISSSDGTKKYLFGVCGSSRVESVMIPDGERRTLCVSSQAGCKMGCRFCMTGRQGWHGNLDVAEILNQYISIDESLELTNTVFMGMGEPLDNYDVVMKAIEVLTAPWGFAWSPKRITLSTIGVMPALRRYLDDCRCHLAVSLHNPFPEERVEMMPVQKAFDEKAVVDLIKQYDFTGQRRVSFEYTMFDGWNDDKRHADALIRLLDGLDCRINLIRFHDIPDTPLQGVSDEEMIALRDYLTNHGLFTTVRASRGQDIFAACGLLSTAEQEKNINKIP